MKVQRYRRVASIELLNVCFVLHRPALMIPGLGRCSASVLHRRCRPLSCPVPAMRLIYKGAMTSLALIWFGAFLAVWSLCRYMSNVWVRVLPLTDEVLFPAFVGPGSLLTTGSV